MPTRRQLPFLLALVAAAFLTSACHHAAKVAQPLAAPPTPPPVHAAAVPETRVAAPSTEFKAPETPSEPAIDSDPLKATAFAEQRGWIRDAFFDFDSATITPDGAKNLTTTATWLRTHEDKFHVLIEGHCDERGTEQYNLALGVKRAYDAKEYLATLGIDAHDIATISYGEDKPFDTGHDETAWAKNRRAHVVLTAASKQ